MVTPVSSAALAPSSLPSTTSTQAVPSGTVVPAAWRYSYSVMLAPPSLAGAAHDERHFPVARRRHEARRRVGGGGGSYRPGQLDGDCGAKRRSSVPRTALVSISEFNGMLVIFLRFRGHRKLIAADMQGPGQYIVARPPIQIEMQILARQGTRSPPDAFDGIGGPVNGEVVITQSAIVCVQVIVSVQAVAVRGAVPPARFSHRQRRSPDGGSGHHADRRRGDRPGPVAAAGAVDRTHLEGVLRAVGEIRYGHARLVGGARHPCRYRREQPSMSRLPTPWSPSNSGTRIP